MRLHLWQKSMDTLLEVEEILTKYASRTPKWATAPILSSIAADKNIVVHVFCAHKPSARYYGRVL